MERCVEVQSQITDYIDGSMSPDGLEEFIAHIRSCKDCREELNIYYTLYLGLWQLEHEDKEIRELNDPDGALDAKLRNSECRIRWRHFLQGLRYAIYTMAFWCILFAAIFQIRMLSELGIM